LTIVNFLSIAKLRFLPRGKKRNYCTNGFAQGAFFLQKFGWLSLKRVEPSPELSKNKVLRKGFLCCKMH